MVLLSFDALAEGEDSACRWRTPCLVKAAPESTKIVLFICSTGLIYHTAPPTFSRGDSDTSRTTAWASKHDSTPSRGWFCLFIEECERSSHDILCQSLF